jgi:hypothetical protein
MGACLDRVLIIADAFAGGGGESRTFGHEVAPVLQAVEIPATLLLCGGVTVYFRNVVC